MKIRERWVAYRTIRLSRNVGFIYPLRQFPVGENADARHRDFPIRSDSLPRKYEDVAITDISVKDALIICTVMRLNDEFR